MKWKRYMRPSGEYFYEAVVNGRTFEIYKAEGGGWIKVQRAKLIRRYDTLKDAKAAAEKAASALQEGS